MNRILVYLGIFFLLGCNKNELKEPINLEVNLSLNNDTENMEHLYFSGGFIYLSSFSFEGKREGADDVFFEKEWSEGKLLALSSSDNLSFQIPKGNYFITAAQFELFDDNDNITLRIEGEFNNENDLKPLIFEFSSNEYFSIIDDTELEVNSDLLYQIVLDPVFWFSTITKADLTNANTRSIGGRETIYIGENFNENLYDIIIDKLDESLEVSF